jgi:hypothetical protein
MSTLKKTGNKPLKSLTKNEIISIYYSAVNKHSHNATTEAPDPTPEIG